jgi:hypothetical protein
VSLIGDGLRRYDARTAVTLHVGLVEEPAEQYNKWEEVGQAQVDEERLAGGVDAVDLSILGRPIGPVGENWIRTSGDMYHSMSRILKTPNTVVGKVGVIGNILIMKNRVRLLLG